MVELCETQMTAQKIYKNVNIKLNRFITGKYILIRINGKISVNFRNYIHEYKLFGEIIFYVTKAKFGRNKNKRN